MRRAHDGVSKPKVTFCSCGEPAMPHRICPVCGKYKGQQVTGGSNEQ
jgi:large subunit ribosomal protein L32